MVLDLALLGTGGMLPLPQRWLASVLIRRGGQLVLFDCGEGTQVTLRALGWGLRHIDLILISHVHADHVAGLPGLLLTLGNSGRVEPLEILGPPGFARVYEGLRVVAPQLPYPVQVREVEGKGSGSIAGFDLSWTNASHSVPCVAYRIDVARQRGFLPERAVALEIPQHLWGALQENRTVTVGNRSFDPDRVLGPPRQGVSVTLITDTRPSADLTRLATRTTLLVCEGTYGSSQDEGKARERFHMTFAEAARMARDAEAKELLLSHFSPALPDPEAFAAEATRIFSATTVGHDHFSLTLAYPPEGPEPAP